MHEKSCETCVSRSVCKYLDKIMDVAHTTPKVESFDGEAYFRWIADVERLFGSVCSHYTEGKK